MSRLLLLPFITLILPLAKDQLMVSWSPPPLILAPLISFTPCFWYLRPLPAAILEEYCSYLCCDLNSPDSVEELPCIHPSACLAPSALAAAPV
eukprot:746503-Hanusia_phi.AAC.1